ncbi:MAG: anti-sigma factor [Chloroflexota bacterium]
MSQPERNLTDCETLSELIPAYSVGATDPEETALVERLLPLCPEAAVELDEYLAMGQAMLRSVPAVQPPTGLHDKLMAVVGAPAQTTTIRPAPSLTSVKPPPAAPIPAARPRVLRTNRWIAGLAVAAAALLIISNVYWVSQVNGLYQQQQAVNTLLKNQEDALASLGTGRANRVQLVSTDTQSQNGVLATVLWTTQSPTALIYSDNLPKLAPDKAYQVWLIKGSQPVSVGVFQPDAQGVGVLIFNSDQPMTDFSAVAISTEPASGSDQPTTTPIAAAQLS